MHCKRRSPPHGAAQMRPLSFAAVKSAENPLNAAGKGRGFQVTGRVGFAVYPAAAEARAEKLAARQLRS